MADFGVQQGGQTRVAPAKVKTEQDLTHHRKGPLGDVAVVPDDYVGPMPQGAIRETDYQRMVGVYGRIDGGASNIDFDTSSFFMGQGQPIDMLRNPVQYLEAAGKAAAFRAEYMDYMRDLVKTPAGLQLLESLDQAKTKTTIMPNLGGGNITTLQGEGGNQINENGEPGTGVGSYVQVDPTAKDWNINCENKNEPWMVDRPRFGFYHELVHAYHNMRGDAARGGHGHVQCPGPEKPIIPEEGKFAIEQTEFQTAGLGPWAGAAVSENAIRAQMGVPLRPNYSGMTWGGRDIWNVPQEKDAEEPPRRSPRR